MLKNSLVLLLSFIAAVTSSPAPTIITDREVKCVNKGALPVLKYLGGPASTFCRSYLRIPATITQTTTIAPAVVTTATSTVTVEEIQSQCPAKAKRDELAENEKRHDLPALSAFVASQLSSGCSCLSLAPKTTATRTITPPATTISVVATTTVCITCAADGQPCSFDRPDLCCGLACLRVLPPVPGGPEATCISF